MPRFLILPQNIRDGHFCLTGTEAHHAIHVLRKKTGDVLDLFDGKDASYRGRIDSISGDQVNGLLLETVSAVPLTLPVVTLYPALLKGPKWDWLLEKLCELGVHRVVPLITARTIVQVGRQVASAKIERWQRIALAAAKQCGRSDRMVVDAPLKFADVLTSPSAQHLRLIPWEKENTKTIRQACKASRQQAADIFIGPEGGWEPAEVDLAVRRGCESVSLGPTLLRAETASLVAATLVLHELGEGLPI